MPEAPPLEICEVDRSGWNNQRCTNFADVIIGGVLTCADCANRLLRADHGDSTPISLL